MEISKHITEALGPLKDGHPFSVAKNARYYTGGNGRCRRKTKKRKGGGGRGQRHFNSLSTYSPRG